MGLSDQLTKLAARAKEAEGRATAAKSEARAELERHVKTARDAAQAQAEELRKTADANKGRISEWQPFLVVHRSHSVLAARHKH